MADNQEPIDVENIKDVLAEKLADSWMGEHLDCSDVADVLAPAVVDLVREARKAG